MTAQNDPQLHDLISRLFDDALDEVDQRKLGDRLQGSAEARELYRAYCDLHLGLSLRRGSTSSSANLPLSADTLAQLPLPQAGNTSRSPASSQRNASISGLWAAGLIAALAASLIAVWFLPFTPESPAVARITDQHSAVWDADGQLPGRSRNVSAGRLHLQQGSAQLEMLCGAIVTLVGPAAIDLVDAKAVRLAHGSITVEAPDSAVGFRVLTPSADVVDLGTEFNVSVDEVGSTEIHVSQGVVVARSSGSDSVIPITRGEAGRVDPEHGDIVPTRFDAARFAARVTASSGPLGRGAAFPPLPAAARVVFLGDRATDRETHLLLIHDALRGLEPDAAPKLFNAGIRFPLLFDESDIARDIAPLRPTHAMLEFGSDLAMLSGRHLLSQQQFETAILRLCDRLEQEGIEPMLSLGFPLDEPFASAQHILDGYNGFLKELAARRGYRLADWESYFRDPRVKESTLTAFNGRWPSFEGHRRIAQATLDAWGYPEVEVAETLEVSLLPGAVTEWKYRFRDAGRSFDDAAAAAIEPDDSWMPLSLPQYDDKFAQRMTDRSHSVSHRDRKRGFATHLFQKESGGVQAVATVHSDTDREVFLNTGATLQAVWINGRQVFRSEGWSGWHAGKERIPVRLQAGENKIVIEAGNSFFVSLTDQADWPVR